MASSVSCSAILEESRYQRRPVQDAPNPPRVVRCPAAFSVMERQPRSTDDAPGTTVKREAGREPKAELLGHVR